MIRTAWDFIVWACTPHPERFEQTNAPFFIAASIEAPVMAAPIQAAEIRDEADRP